MVDIRRRKRRDVAKFPQRPEKLMKVHIKYEQILSTWLMSDERANRLQNHYKYLDWIYHRFVNNWECKWHRRSFVENEVKVIFKQFDDKEIKIPSRNLRFCLIIASVQDKLTLKAGYFNWPLKKQRFGRGVESGEMRSPAWLLKPFFFASWKQSLFDLIHQHERTK